jgi:hypothetical protein
MGLVEATRPMNAYDFIKKFEDNHSILAFEVAFNYS